MMLIIIISVCFLLDLSNCMLNDGRRRHVLRNSYGSVGVLNGYQKAAHYEWLIQAPPRKFVGLRFRQLSLECLFDFVYVYDGASTFNGPLLGLFTSSRLPSTNLWSNGSSMYILLHSDANNVYEGFLADYWFSDCPANCSDNGRCVDGSCLCKGNWSGNVCQISPCSHSSCLKTPNHISGSLPETIIEDKSGNIILFYATNTVVQLDGKIWTYIYGGLDTMVIFRSEMYRMDNKTGYWTKVLYNNWIQRLHRCAHTTTFDRSSQKLYIFGGLTRKSSIESLLSADLLTFDLKTNTWSQLISTNDVHYPSARAWHSFSYILNRYLLLIGGVVSNGIDCISDHIFLFDTKCHVWTRVNESAVTFVTNPINSSFFEVDAMNLCEEHLKDSCVDPCFWCYQSSKCSKNVASCKNCSTVCPFLSSCTQCLSASQCRWCAESNSCVEIKNSETMCYGDYVSIENCFNAVPESGILVSMHFGVKYQPYTVEIARSKMITFTSEHQTFLEMSAFVSWPGTLAREFKISVSNVLDCHIWLTLNEVIDKATLLSNATTNVLHVFEHSALLHDFVLVRSKDVEIGSRHLLVIQATTIPQRSATFTIKGVSLNHLEPYHEFDCSGAYSCLMCLLWPRCVWIYSQFQYGSCIQKSKAMINIVETAQNCPACTDFITCLDCTSRNCAWNLQSNVCEWPGISVNDTVLSGDFCPSPCFARMSCIDCLANDNRCGWCLTNQRCFGFDAYWPSMGFGKCLHWFYWQQGQGVCSYCSTYKDCASCIGEFGCGWCQQNGNIGEGECVEGTFYGDTNRTCLQGNLWSYEKCHSACDLVGMKCSKNAKCIDDNDELSCQCNSEYSGDGFTCTKMCHSVCFNGYCSELTNFECLCNIGWTGEDCSVDCLCFNNSRCTVPGQCIECLDRTTGDRCDQCVDGAYGDPLSIGCHLCLCNGHGDVDRKYCNSTTGICFCSHNTYGHHCSYCLPGYFGDPRNGRHCAFDCHHRTSIGEEIVEKGASLGASKAPQISRSNTSLHTCVWILKSRDALPIRLKFRKSFGKKIDCVREKLTVYDGVPELIAGQTSKILYNLCDFPVEGHFVIATSGRMTIIFRGHLPSDTLVGGSRFSAHFQQNNFSCKNNCWSKFQRGKCDLSSGRCLCVEGFIGADCSVRLGIQSLSTTILNRTFSDFASILLPDGKRTFVPYFNSSWRIINFNKFSGMMSETKVEMPLGIEREHFAATVHPSGDQIYLSGGISSEGKILSDFWIGQLSQSLDTIEWISANNTFEPQSNILNKTTPTLSLPLAGHTLTFVDDSLFIVGGYTPNAGLGKWDVPYEYRFNKYVYKTDIFNQSLGLWSRLSGGVMSTSQYTLTLSTTIVGVYGHSTCYHKGMLYVFGGWSEDNLVLSPTSHLYQIELATGFWGKIEPRDYSQCCNHIQPLPLLWSKAFTIANNIVIFGYYDNRLIIQMIDIIVSRRWFVPLVDFAEKTYESYQNIDFVRVSEYKFVILGHSVLYSVIFPNDLCSLLSSSECSNENGCKLCAFSNENGNVSCVESSSTSFACSTAERINDEYQNDFCSQFVQCSDCINYKSRCKWCPGSCATGWGGNCLDLNKNCSINDQKQNKQICDGSCIYLRPISYPQFQGTALPNSCHTCLLQGPILNGDIIWSDSLNKCLHVKSLPLYCNPMDKCEPLISELSHCSIKCSYSQSCAQCQRTLSCGWCANDDNDDGAGYCVDGHSEQCLPGFSWHYLDCPSENECNNNHHNCNETTEQCVDMPSGFFCNCAKGFERSFDGVCVPICNPHCVNGHCLLPNICQCDLGWTGHLCDFQCKCNGHSDCPGPNHLDKCVKCLHNSAGAQCDLCLPGYVGVNNECLLCAVYCNHNSQTCVNSTRTILGDFGSFGVNSKIICSNCRMNTIGDRCDQCKPGFWKRPTGLSWSCVKCRCNDHSDDNYCNPETGGGCFCRNNTESSCNDAYHSTVDGQLCGLKQCDQCIEGFFGYPIYKGNQCYRKLREKHDACFQSTTSGLCKTENEFVSSTLGPREMIFLMIDRIYSNVDIRLVIDVTDGELEINLHTLETGLKVQSDKNGDKRIEVKSGSRQQMWINEPQINHPFYYPPLIHVIHKENNVDNLLLKKLTRGVRYIVVVSGLKKFDDMERDLPYFLLIVQGTNYSFYGQKKLTVHGSLTMNDEGIVRVMPPGQGPTSQT